MIGYLSGTVIESSQSEVLVGVGGVGYRVRVNSKFKIQNSKEVELFVHTYVREDEISLYGFLDKKSLKMFEMLIGVSGVGPKVGMSILGQRSAEEIQKAVATADVGFFTGVKGVGKKGAQKIIIELKNKLGDLADLDLGEDGGGDDLVSALVGMGFLRKDVVEMLRKIEPGMSEDERLKFAIKKLGRR